MHQRPKRLRLVDVSCLDQEPNPVGVGSLLEVALMARPASSSTIRMRRRCEADASAAVLKITGPIPAQ